MHISIGWAQLSSTMFMLSFAFAQLIYGPLSDLYGRKNILLLGLSLLLVGIILLVLFPSPTMLMITRIIQGAGAAAVSVLAKAMIHDHYQNEKAVGAYSVLVMITAITPCLAPFLGGHLQDYFGWQGVFIALALYVLLVIIIDGFFLIETKKNSTQPTFELLTILKNYALILRDKELVGYSTLMFLTFTCQMAYLTIAPFIFQNTLHLSASYYGDLILLPTIAYVISNYVSKSLIKKLKILTVIKAGIAISILSGCFMLFFGTFLSQSIAATLLPITLNAFGSGFIFSNTIMSGLKRFPNAAGSAGAVLGFMQMIGTGLIGFIISHYRFHTLLQLGIVVSICTLLMAMTVVWILWQSSSVDTTTLPTKKSPQ